MAGNWMKNLLNFKSTILSLQARNIRLKYDDKVFQEFVLHDK